MIVAKEDKRKALPSYGWAPGDYLCVCIRCSRRFWGEKRANRCADCAYEEKDRAK